jgi:hypothetical protein
MKRTARIPFAFPYCAAAAILLAAPASAQRVEWAKMPHMQLERQFAGPLQDTIVQRWRDPIDGTVCYIYLPITAAHSPPTDSGYVQYGSNSIGSISCSPSTNTGRPPVQAKSPTQHTPSVARPNPPVPPNVPGATPETGQQR